MMRSLKIAVAFTLVVMAGCDGSVFDSDTVERTYPAASDFPLTTVHDILSSPVPGSYNINVYVTSVRICPEGWKCFLPDGIVIADENVVGTVVNSGGSLWILGWKSECDFTQIVTRDSGSTELLGGFLMPGISLGTRASVRSTAFRSSDGGRQSLSYVVWNSLAGMDFPVHVEESRDGVPRQLSPKAVEQATGGVQWATRTQVPLYVGSE